MNFLLTRAKGRTTTGLRSPRSGTVALAVALALALGLASSARAEDAENGAAADALFQEGKALEAKGSVHEACPKFAASYKLDKKLGTLLNLADCLERDGKTASAWLRFDEAVTWSKAEPDERGAFAERRRDALTPVVPTVRLSVTQGAEKLSVYRDGVLVGEDGYGLPIKVDPGTVVIAVRRGDQLLEEQSVSVKPGAELEVPVDLARIAKAHPPSQPNARVPRGQRTAGFVVGAVGIAGLVTFGILEGVAYGQKAKADGVGGCRSGFCSPEGFALERKAGNYAEAGQWVGIGSAAAVAIGATLLLTAPRSSPTPEKRRVTVVPIATATAWGLAVGGSL